MVRVLAAPMIVLAYMVGVPPSAIAQSGVVSVSHVEVWAGVSVAPTGPAGVLVTSYSPPLLFDGDFTSRGGQTVNAETGATTGFTAGMNVFPFSHVGFQLMLDRASWNVEGMNPP